MRETTPQSRRKQASAIDWSELNRCLETAHAALQAGLAPPPEQARQILRARAQALAREAEERPAPGEQLEVVEFLLAYERYGIESSCVREVYPLKELTPLPGTPPFAPGIINVRGQILSLIDIKKFFDLLEKGLGDLNKVIVVASGQMQVGILADVILGVHAIPLQDLQPSLPTLREICADYLKRVTRDRLVLDVERLLSDRTLVLHQ